MYVSETPPVARDREPSFTLGAGELTDTWTATGASEVGTLTTQMRPGERPVTVPALRFTGSTAKVALVFAGVHGTEPQGVEVANELCRLLEAAAPGRRPEFTTIVIPELFAASRRDAKDKRLVKEHGTGRLLEPNRNFPAPGESYAYARQRGRMRKDNAELLGCNGEPLTGDKLTSRMLPETRILIQLIEQVRPVRTASLHAQIVAGAKRGDGPGIFVDPRGRFNEHTDKSWTDAGQQDDALIKAMLSELLRRINPELPLTDRSKKKLVHPFAGNLLDRSATLGTSPTVHYTSTRHLCGSSFGMWAPAPEFGRGGRQGVTTVTVELPRYSNAEAASRKVVEAHVAVLAERFLRLT